MNYKEIIYEKEKPLAWITLNRPERLNAYTFVMGQEIARALGEAQKDRSIKVVIVTGAGRGFCAGVDIRGGRGKQEEADPLRRDTAMGPPIRKLNVFDKPVIAATNGVTVGGGLSFVMACDIRIASDRATFSSIFIKVGALDNGFGLLLPRLVGIGMALELSLTGDIISAAEAERIGLVNHVVPHDDLISEVRKLATRIANNSPVTVRLTKRAMYKGTGNTDLLSQMELERTYAAINSATEYSQEKTRASVKKREPKSKGR